MKMNLDQQAKNDGETWDERAYLDRYPDVKAAVLAGKISTGLEHYQLHGKAEGRISAFKNSLALIKNVWPWSDYLYLLQNPELRPALNRLNCTAREHFVRSGEAEKRLTGFETMRNDFLQRTSLPTWAMSEMEALSYFDPNLDVEAYKPNLIYNPFSKHEIASQLLQVSKYLNSDEYDTVFFLPWLKKGGADLASLYHIYAVAGTGVKVAVCLTEDSESEWADRVPSTVDIIPIGKIFHGIDLRLQAQLIYHFLSAVHPRQIHIINSHLAWSMLKWFSLPLSTLTEVFVSLYCYDYNEWGEPVGYARDIRDCVHSVAGIFTDNSTFKAHLVREIGVSAEIIHVLAHPVMDPPLALPPRATSRKVLWASRLDTQKQPEILVEIASRLPNLTFDVYGSAVTGSANDVLATFAKCPNIVYRGPFSSPSDVLQEEYLCFLYTSLWDGLPNILLEMLWGGMLIIAPDIGGIKADLGPESCVIVDDAKDASQYIKALQWVTENPEEALTKRLEGQRLVQARHTQINFNASLSAAGYLPQ